MKSLVVGFTGTAPSTTATQFNTLSASGASTWSTSAAARNSMVPAALTFDNLAISMDTAPGVGKSYTFELYKNGSAAGVIVTIADTATTGASTTSVVCAAGDKLSLRCLPTGTPTASGTVRWSIRMDGTKFAIFGETGTPPTTAATNYLTAMGRSTIAATEPAQSQVVAAAGVIDKLYFSCSTAFTGSHAITLFKNGVATGITATLTNPVAGATVTDLSNTVSVVAGDIISYRLVTTSASAIPFLFYGVSFTPTTAGQFFIAVSYSVNASASAVNYIYPVGDGGAGYSATPDARRAYIRAATLVGIYAAANTAPGAGQSRSVQVRINGANLASAAVISGTNTAGNITGLSQDISAATVEMLTTPTGTPAASAVKMGLLMVVTEPPSSGNMLMMFS